MPNYVFAQEGNPKKVTERFYHMDEAPSIGSLITDPDGTQWRRLAVKPQASFDTHADPYSGADFVKATNKKGTIGDMWDRSAEMGAKRRDKEGGRDPVQQKFYDDYAKRRRGKRHPQELREEGSRRLKQKGITIHWGDES
jgi:Ni/Co efflux regulator RcnB